MKKIKIFKLLLMGLCALTISSCDDNDPDSVVTSFAKYPISTTTAAVVAPEVDEETYTFEFTLDGEKQINPVTLEVEVADNSTATEGVDFELSAHEFALDAFAGQDGFSLEITVLQDFEVEGEDETIYLNMHSVDPSGVEKFEMLVVTIKDSGLYMDFTLNWTFDDDAQDPISCDVDIDMTFQLPGVADPYDEDDLLGYATSTAACPEQGTLFLAAMEDGVEYNVWIVIYGGPDFDFGDASAMTLSIDYEKPDGTGGTIEIGGVFDSRMEEEFGVIGTIQKDGDVITFKDNNGDVIATGRSGGVQLMHGIKKPI